MDEEEYIKQRLREAEEQSMAFERCRHLPINPRKVVFTAIEGTTGFTCNPKYIALELLRRHRDYDLVWLVNDMTKEFPVGIRKVENTLENRAFELSTARIWIDNSRKQLEVRKRPGQVYLQTWHAKLGFKPTCFDRGASFSRIAQLVSQHDSDLIDYVLSNSDWYDKTLPRGMLYAGPVLRTGSPRCDVLVNRTEKERDEVRRRFGLPRDARIMMYAPTFRGGSQGIERRLGEDSHSPDCGRLVKALESRFSGRWYVFLRLHPQMTVRHIESHARAERLVNVSKIDDMYEILAGCDAFLTDYSSAAFDAAVMGVPVLIYADDYGEYEAERGKLLWNLRELPFPLAETNEELEKSLAMFDEQIYRNELERLFQETGMLEDGHASERVADWIEERLQ